MRFFPDNEEEISLIKFIAEYQYINVRDAKYFFKSSRYYRNRIKNLINKDILRKIKWSLALGETGIEYCKLLNIKYNKLNRNKTYRQRLLKLSNIAAYYQSCETVKFTPSFSIKDKEVFTTTARRYIGLFNINGIEYLTYKITKEHDNIYISSVIYDIEKEFLGKTIFPTLGKKKKDEQNNYCGECGCSCTCDGGCKGDPEKCTSKKAIEKGCSHCCICYTAPMSNNIQKVTVETNPN